MLAGAGTFPAYSAADTLLVEKIKQEPSNSVEGLPRPRRGMSMQQVSEAFGRPANVSPPVGKPAIVRWSYPEFVVFFERDTVIDIVIPRASANLD